VAKPTTKRRTVPARTTKSRVVPFLMFDDRLGEAIDLYTSVLPDSKVRRVARGGKGGAVLSAEFEIGGQVFMAYAGGPHFTFSEGFSLFVECADQAEVDRIWAALRKAGAEPSQCGWITDPFGLSWQVVPRRFLELVADKDPRKAKAVFEAMFPMQKLDLAALERAHAEA
jgi:predicted 3-demethylubiquinone-9 3-methyltransferase (glyoxalase superfamily)